MSTKTKEEIAKELIDKLLSDNKFRSMVENDIGIVFKVDVDWENNNINFYGSDGAKQLKIDATLAVLKGEIQ